MGKDETGTLSWSFKSFELFPEYRKLYNTSGNSTTKSLGFLSTHRGEGSVTSGTLEIHGPCVTGGSTVVEGEMV